MNPKPGVVSTGQGFETLQVDTTERCGEVPPLIQHPLGSLVRGVAVAHFDAIVVNLRTPSPSPPPTPEE